MGQDDIATMIKFLDPEGKKKVDYNEFMSVLFDPDYFLTHKDIPSVLWYYIHILYQKIKPWINQKFEEVLLESSNSCIFFSSSFY